MSGEPSHSDVWYLYCHNQYDGHETLVHASDIDGVEELNLQESEQHQKIEWTL